MSADTIESPHWVKDQRETPIELGIQDPDQYLGDSSITAVAMKLLLTRYIQADLSPLDAEFATSWLVGLGIELTEGLGAKIAAEHERLYGDPDFRNGVLRVLYTKDLDRKKGDPD